MAERYWQGDAEVLEENESKLRFVHYKSHMDWDGT